MNFQTATNLSRQSIQTLQYHWDKDLPQLPSVITSQPYCFLELAGGSNRQIRLEYQASHVRGCREHDSG